MSSSPAASGSEGTSEGGSGVFGNASRSTAASGAIVYEGERAVQEYLQFHYGRYLDAR